MNTALPVRDGYRRRHEFLGFSPPLLGEEECLEMLDTLRSDWISTGPKTRLFEAEFARYVDAPRALALNSCTAGLHLALVTAGIGAGDEVITTTMTFAASVNVIEHVRARPVLADVEDDTLNLDPRLVEAAVSPRTRALVAVHYGGHPAELGALEALAEQRRLLLIEDAAHALPAWYDGRMIGGSANPVAFSFYATKNMTTGEGGMLTGAADFVEEARVLSLHGMSRAAWGRYAKGGSWRYDVAAPGFKYNMTDIQASLGIQQLRKLESFQVRRREIVGLYDDAFRTESALETPVCRPGIEPAWHLYVLRLNLDALRIDRDRFIEELADRNIGTSVHFIPIHMHSYYRQKYGYQPGDFPVAERAFERIVSLPVYPRMGLADAEDVALAVLDVVREYRR